MRPRLPIPGTHRVVRVIAAALVLAVAATGRAGAQDLQYEGTAFLHGLGSDSVIWTLPFGSIGGRNVPQFLSQRVFLKIVRTPRLNAGAPDEDGLPFSGQRTNFLSRLDSVGGPQVVVAHSLGGVVARGAYQVSGVAASRTAGIVAIAVPHQGARIADSADFAATYLMNLDHAIARAKPNVAALIVLEVVVHLLSRHPFSGYYGIRTIESAGSNGDLAFPADAVYRVARQRALPDLKPSSATIAALENYTGDYGVPRANIRGSIPYGHAILRLGAATGLASYEDLKSRVDRGLSLLRKCRNMGDLTFNLGDLGNKCQLAASMLGALDAKWAGWVNGTEYGRRNIFFYGQIPRKIPGDGVVPNERSIYPGGNLVRDLTMPMANHQDIYRLPDPLNEAANAMVDMGMLRTAPLLDPTVSGPGQFEYAQTLTWTAAAAGGDGSYSYEWQWRPEGHTSWYWLGGDAASASKYVDESTSGFNIRVKVSSQGQVTWNEFYVANATSSGGSCAPPLLQCE